eukprot:TRINITY_DN1554_c0_g1_i1.p1 TRINITY_DN1554_c0_g1~~TRINITY_DN1554_c0_g1_i1.p1  ORF type:complete len:177 (-),score=32.63 TRINITY_DN1554_c0_g1_i1:32-502(-)
MSSLSDDDERIIDAFLRQTRALEEPLSVARFAQALGGSHSSARRLHSAYVSAHNDKVRSVQREVRRHVQKTRNAVQPPSDSGVGTEGNLSLAEAVKRLEEEVSAREQALDKAKQTLAQRASQLAESERGNKKRRVKPVSNVAHANSSAAMDKLFGV